MKAAHPAVPSATPKTVGPDAIVIENLLVQARVGVFASEKGQTQALRFDIEMRTVPDYGKVVRETGEYVSYADAVEFIERKAHSGEHVELLEEWAELVACFVLENPLVESVQVKVTKPDIIPAADGVGIRIVRTRAPQ